MLTKKNYFKNLQEQNFHKLIIGAALKDFQAIEDYSFLFTHAQADVIDISAFPHSVISAQKGIDKAIKEDSSLKKPLIMVSVNIGKDPHFRRIELDFDKCTKCQACIPSCPSDAFYLDHKQDFKYNIDLCFACSNCLPECHFDALEFSQWDSFDTNSLLELTKLGASAIEIHLNNDLIAFKEFYFSYEDLFELESFCIGSAQMNQEELIKAAEMIISSAVEKHGENYNFIIQTDGIPISGTSNLIDKDQVSIDNAKIILEYIAFKHPQLKESIHVQLAGGTNERSLEKALSQNVQVSGLAIGSYARKKLKDCVDPYQAKELAKSLISLSRSKYSLD